MNQCSKFMQLGVAFIIILLAIAPVVNAQSTAIKYVNEDGRGEMFMTVDSLQNSIIRNIADGKIAGRYIKDDPALPAKVLRYRIATIPFKYAGTSENSLDYGKGPTFINVFSKDGIDVAKVTLNQSENHRSEWHKQTGMIALATNNGKSDAKLYIINTKPQSDTIVTEMKLIATYPSDYYLGLAFSPKGQWLMDWWNLTLVELATGKIIKLPASIKAGNISNKVVFNVDETKLMFGIPNQMIVVETATGKILEKVSVPKSIRGDEKKFIVHPLSDGKSFIYYGNYRNPIPGWLVRDGEVINLKD